MATASSWVFAVWSYRVATTGLGTMQKHPAVARFEPYSFALRTAIDPSANSAFSFLQLSDIHVSKYTASGGIHHLNSLILNEIPLLAPDLVLATGDLTDAKFVHSATSEQHREEWIKYYSSLQSSRVILRNNQTFWFDQRGNHDCFNVPSWDSPQNYYATLSASKTQGFAFKIKKSFGNYSFIALDACPQIGPSKPLNFFGTLDKKDLDFLSTSLLDARDSSHIFVASHYPTSFTYFGFSTAGLSVWQLSPMISIWFSGHLHKLAGGLGEQMYARQKGKVLELELGDLKKHGMYRLVVVDNDLVSFRDLEVYPGDAVRLPLIETAVYNNRPPIVMVTNPIGILLYNLDMRYTVSNQPFHLLKSSTHLRVFIWSKAVITAITATIDGQLVAEKFEYAGIGKAWSDIRNLHENQSYLPLWIAKWDPSLYTGTHRLVVRAIDENGFITEDIVVFQIMYPNGSTPVSVGIGGFLISVELGYLFKELFVVSYFVLVALLLLPKTFVMITRYLNIHESWMSSISEDLIRRDEYSLEYTKSKLQKWPSFSRRMRHVHSDFIFTMKAAFLRQCEISSDPWIFYVLYGFLLYIPCFPWLVADFVPSSGTDFAMRYGYLYLYGIQMFDGTWEPMLDTWLFGFYTLIYQYFPFVAWLSFNSTSPDRLYSRENPRRVNPIHQRWYIQTLVVVVCVFNIMDCWSVYSFYGIYAALLSPSKTWFTIWAIYSVWRLHNSPMKSFKKE